MKKKFFGGGGRGGGLFFGWACYRNFTVLRNVA